MTNACKYGGRGRKIDCSDIDIGWLGKRPGFLDIFLFGWLSIGGRAEVYDEVGCVESCICGEISFIDSSVMQIGAQMNSPCQPNAAGDRESPKDIHYLRYMCFAFSSPRPV